MQLKQGTSRSFSPAFEHLCSFVAIRSTQKGDEVLRQLLMQSIVILPDERITSVDQLRSCLDTLFGLQMPIDRLELALDQLIREGKVYRPGGTYLSVEPGIYEEIKKRIEDATALQDRVKAKWLDGSVALRPNLDRGQAWSTLQRYLSAAFRRHGMQTVALLGAYKDISSENFDSLQAILQEAIGNNCEVNQRSLVESSIRDFLASTGSDADRSQFIVQLADGTFSYYSLTVPPEVAAQLSAKLNELTLFLDTNFIFGILDLHSNPLVEVSNELLRVIENNRLPFKLRFHKATQEEFHRTIQAFSRSLSHRRWPPSISRAASKSRNVSGVEQRYHARNALSPIAVADFFKPYEHVDVLLKDKGMLIYRPREDRGAECNELMREYREFLDSRGKEKPTESLLHDVTVLDCVGGLRSKARSSLEAGALCITCDYLLARFDWERAEKNNTLIATILPNQFMQLLRPFIPANQDFDRSFAETFAIPEFRTVNSSSALAASKMLSLLATYGPIREETASSLLCNDMLLDNLRAAKDDREFAKYVESAVEAENSSLLEEKIAVSGQLEREKSLHAVEVKQYEEIIRQLEFERDELAKVNAEPKPPSTESRDSEYLSLRQSFNDQNAELTQAKKDVNRLATLTDRYKTAVALIAGILFAATFESLAQYLNWQWLLAHQNGYGIRAGLYVGGLLFFLGVFRTSWRKWCWGSGLLGILYVLIQILGGPKRP